MSLVKQCLDALDHTTRAELMDSFNNLVYYRADVTVKGKQYYISVHDNSETTHIEKAGYFTCGSP